MLGERRKRRGGGEREGGEYLVRFDFKPASINELAEGGACLADVFVFPV